MARRLTDKQREFAAAMAATGDKRLAAERAGYAFPEVAGSAQMAKPSVTQEVLRLQLERLATDVVPLAISTLVDVMRQRDAHGPRVMAAKIALDRGFGQMTADLDKPASEMTAAELDKEIRRLRVEMSDRAKDVTAGRVVEGEVVDAADEDVVAGDDIFD